MYRLSLLGAFVASSVFSMDLIPDLVQVKTHLNNLTSIVCDNTAERCLTISTEVIEKFLDESHVLYSIDHCVYQTGNGGETWSKPFTLSGGTHDVVVSTDVGGIEEYNKLQAEKYMQIRCDDTGTTCLIAGVKYIKSAPYMIVHKTQDGGAHWNESKLIPFSGKVSGLDNLVCGQSGDRCLLLAYPLAYISKDSGQTWSQPISFPKPKTGYPWFDRSHISCSYSGLRCTVVTGMPAITYVTQDGGLTWGGPYELEAENYTDEVVDTDYFSKIHCDSSGLNCMALRYRLVKRMNTSSVLTTFIDVYTTANSGITWKKTGTINNSDWALYEAFGLLDCDKTGQRCVAIHSPAGTQGSKPRAYVTTDRGQNWQHVKIKSSENIELSDLFCDSNGILCQAVGLKFD
ncbi:MAG: hypothetical protein P1U61_08460 [Legionellaceae bacterium]|nr:hypothetical protein [Legionellaceae bacterium]